MMTEEASKILFETFVNRKDTYTTQTEKGTYQRIAKEITENDIKDHLEGKKTIGLYQINQENKLKWVCFDFDGKNLEEQFELAKKFSQTLKEKDIPHLLEFSGKKGYHIWIFCEEADAASAKYWAEEISEEQGVHEIFPKQTKITDGYGNCVKLPLGIHQVSKNRSYFFNDSFEQLSTHESIELLEKKAKQNTKIPKVIIKEIIRTVIKPVIRQPIPSSIQYLINKGAAEGERHKSAWIITKELYNAGFSKNEIIEHVLTFNNNCKEPKDEYTVASHVKYLLTYPEKYLHKETIEEKDQEEIEAMTKATYKKVIETYNKWFYLKNNHVIDLALAVAISRKEKMQPLWIIMIAPSGSGKSELLRPLVDTRQPSTTEIMSKITPNTFLSGISKKREDHIDFAETLENNPKLFLTFDFAQFVKLESKEKAQIWAQLRDVYDGFIERKAFNVSKKVENIKINWLICSTPIIDTELLIQQELGTRELIFRFEHEEVEKKDLMRTIRDNIGKQEKMRTELRLITRAFIERKESEGFKKIEINDEVWKELETLALTISALRAATESDAYTGELINFVYEEMPTRILLQLRDLYVALRNLDKEYSHEKTMALLDRVTISSIHPVRYKIMMEIIENPNISTTGIQKSLSIGWKNVYTQLYTAKQLGLIRFIETESEIEGEGQARGWKKKTWYVTEHDVVKYLKNLGKKDEEND